MEYGNVNVKIIHLHSVKPQKSGTVIFCVLNITLVILGIRYKDNPQNMYVNRRPNGNCYYLQQIKIKINLYVIVTELCFCN
jgi:hypothetical protein